MKQEDKNSNLKRFVLGALAVPIPLSADYTVVRYINPHIVKPRHIGDFEVSSYLLKDFFDKVKKKYNLTTTYLDSKNVDPSIKFPHFNPVENNIVGTKKFLGTDIHEIGHAVDFRKISGKPISKLRKLIYNRFAPITTTIAGSIAATSDNEKVRNWAVPISISGYLPELKREAAASLIGYKELKDYLRKKPYVILDPTEALRKVKGYLSRSFLTYLIPAVGVGGSVWLIKKYKDNEEKINNKLKNYLFKNKH